MIENLDNEIWRDVVGYEGLYQVSSLGKVKSLNYNKTGEERVLKFDKNKSGYLYVTLYNKGHSKAYRVHRLVAQAFIPNFMNLPCVNHKDENPSNNCVGNLEWCTHKYNNNYGSLKNKKLTEETKLKIGLAQKGIYNTKCSKSVLQFDLDNNFIQEFPSSAQVERDLGFDKSNISRVCLGKLKTYKGYIWKYKEVV